MKKVLFSFTVFVAAVFFFSNGFLVKEVQASIGECFSSEEAKLANLINNYRKNVGLGEIPISQVLTKTAQLHAQDLELNSPHSSASCNLHSWSNANEPQISAVCYTDDHSQASKMWSKPNEVSAGQYTGNGFEIAAQASSSISANDAFNLWINSPAHKALIEESGIWENSAWPGFGVGIYGKYAVVWFGDQADTNSINQCVNEYVDINRFWRNATSSHFYTADLNEAAYLKNNDTSWKFEDIVFRAYSYSSGKCSKGSEVFRFYSPTQQVHFYTADANEKDFIISTNPNWKYESVAYCAEKSSVDGFVPVYQFWSESRKAHFYTTDANEKNYIQSSLSNIYRYEGIVYYVKGF